MVGADLHTVSARPRGREVIRPADQRLVDDELRVVAFSVSIVFDAGVPAIKHRISRRAADRESDCGVILTHIASSISSYSVQRDYLRIGKTAVRRYIHRRCLM